MSAISSEAKVRRWGREPCGKRTIGLLQRRHIQIEKIKYIGRSRTASKLLKQA
jgi:hypothetical protein